MEYWLTPMGSETHNLSGTGTSAEFAVLSRMVGIWRASQDKTANPYVIEIAI